MAGVGGPRVGGEADPEVVQLLLVNAEPPGEGAVGRLGRRGGARVCKLAGEWVYRCSAQQLRLRLTAEEPLPFALFVLDHHLPDGRRLRGRGARVRRESKLDSLWAMNCLGQGWG